MTVFRRLYSCKLKVLYLKSSAYKPQTAILSLNTDIAPLSSSTCQSVLYSASADQIASINSLYLCTALVLLVHCTSVLLLCYWFIVLVYCSCAIGSLY